MKTYETVKLLFLLVTLGQAVRWNWWKRWRKGSVES